jgi:predicted enzyme related to lactoylglutathione lyase
MKPQAEIRQEADTVAKIENHPPGQFCWTELATTNRNSGRDFYTAIFDWVVHEVPIGPDSFYCLYQYDQNDCCGAYTMDEHRRTAGVRPRWLPYVCVEHAEKTAMQAVKLGGTVTAGPGDVADKGAMAMIRDPQGAMIAVWQPRTQIGATNGDLYWRHCWTELSTTDIAAARDFYTKLFGWQVHSQPMGGMDYLSWICEGGPTGGGYQMSGEQRKSEEPRWTVYFSVPDCDAIAAKVLGSGGTVSVPPTDIPNVGRFAACQDPDGAGFSIIRLKQT